jgi:hypothetical protein
VLTLALSAVYSWAVFRGRDPDALLFDAAASALALGLLATLIAFCLFSGYMPQHGVPHWGTIVICGTYAMDRTARAFAGRARTR